MALSLMPCYVQCPAHSGAVHLDSLWMACLCRVKLTITSFVVASGPVTLMELRVALNCLPWYHNDPGVICASSILGKMSEVFSSQCEHRIYRGQGDTYEKKREIRDVFHSLVLHSSEVSIKGSEVDSSWGWIKDSQGGWIFSQCLVYLTWSHQDLPAQRWEQFGRG